MAEALLKEWISMILLTEGGHAFSDVRPVSADELRRLWPELQSDLVVLGVSDIRAVGTTLMKDPAADIDLVGSYDGDRGDLIDAARSRFGRDNVASSGANTVSIAYPIPGGRKMQVDVFIGNPEYIGWARSGVDPKVSPVKASVRNMLWNSIFRRASAVHFPAERQSDTEMVRYVIDHDRGLFKAFRRRKSPMGKWKTVEKEFVTDDPREIVQAMLGDEFEPGDLATFESTVEALSSSPRTADLVGDVLNDVLGALDSKQMKRKLGDVHGSIMKRVRQLAGQ